MGLLHMLNFFVKKSAAVLKIFENIWRHVSKQKLQFWRALFLERNTLLHVLFPYFQGPLVFWSWPGVMSCFHLHNRPYEFLGPLPRGATKKIGIKCAFHLTQTVYMINTGRALELSQYYRKLFDWPPSQYVTTHDPDALTRHIIVTAADFTHAL